MDYKAKDYSGLIGMEGFSETLLRNHFKLYEGYVKNTNALLSELAAMMKDDGAGTPAHAELKRRLGWEFNGMRLHEYYFENLGGGKTLEKGLLEKRLAEDFGSFDAWRSDFTSTAKMRGIGWAALYEDQAAGRLFNFWINEHDVGHPAGCRLILIMDVFEHAFMTDYGLNRAGYIEAFFENAGWEAAERRLKGA